MRRASGFHGPESCRQAGSSIGWATTSWPFATPRLTAADAPTPNGSASLQLAFKVSASEVDQCADELVRHGINLLSPPTDQVFGHRTLFFRDPDGNLLEVFADI